MNIDMLDKPRRKRRSRRSIGTVADDAPVAALLRCYRHHWTNQPLLLVAVPGIRDPRKDVRAALDDAWSILERASGSTDTKSRTTYIHQPAAARGAYAHQ